MANHSVKKLKYDNLPVAVEVAKRDINGAQIDTTYVKTVNNVAPVDGNVSLSVSSGDVTGPSSATSGHVAIFNGTTGKAIKDGTWSISGTSLKYVSSGLDITNVNPWSATSFTYNPILNNRGWFTVGLFKEVSGEDGNNFTFAPGTDGKCDLGYTDGTTARRFRSLHLTGLLNLNGDTTNPIASGDYSNIGSNGIRWGASSLPQDTAPQYVCTIDAFANGGRQKWASIADLKTALAVPTSYVSSVNGSTGAITNVAKTNANNTFTGSNSFTGTVGNTQTSAGVYLGLDTNSSPNANIAIVSANTAAYIDMGSPNEDYGFRIIKWASGNAEFCYASYTVTVPQKTGTIALTSDLGTQVTFSYSSGTLTITPK